jgi:acyl carrier protein
MQTECETDSLEAELKKLIIEALKLEDISPEQIDSAEPLFGDGLGLDSIDALELGVILRKRYGIKIATVTDEVKMHFATIRNLARFIKTQQGNVGHA